MTTDPSKWASASPLTEVIAETGSHGAGVPAGRVTLSSSRGDSLSLGYNR